MKITILEFTPCADSIYHVRRDAEEGYIAGDASAVTIKSGAKLRPRMVSTYAGGKATNVARVMDKLLNEDDAVEIELVVFRPDSPEGRYIHDLQTAALARVRVRPVIIKGRARTCVDLIDPATDRASRVEFNISPRAVWETSALETAYDFAKWLSTDLLLLAGNPPVIETTGEMVIDLYARLIEAVRSRVRIISVDTEKGALANCLTASAQPDVIKINEQEYASVDNSLWKGFSGELIVTDATGCRVSGGQTNLITTYIRGAEVADLYSTIGAGDSVHAGFTLARWVWRFDAFKSARYGQAAAAASVSSPDGTRGVAKETVERFFERIENAEH
jgi:fructose-1-phosphate kinase PfkB-like protein